MATTNFQIWNPNFTNAETDSAYTADSLRQNGAATGALLPSQMTNKAYGQWSIFIAAMAQMMVNKGYTVLDSNFSNLVAVLSNIKTSADFPASIVTVTYSSSIAFNAATASQFFLTLTGNVASSTLSGTFSGQQLWFIIAQDATGGRTFSWPSTVTSPGQICPLASSISVQQFDVLPTGQIISIGRMLWVTSSGLIVPSANVVYPVTTSGNIQILAQEVTEECNTSSGAITRNLFTAVGYSGFKVNVKNLTPGGGTNQLLVQPVVSGQTIDGYPNFGPIPNYNSITFISDGSNWIII